METPQILLYGIPNCDSVKKARAWLDEQGIIYNFQDFKKNPPHETQIKGWLELTHWESLINKKSSTWRALNPSTRAMIADVPSTCRAIMAYPSLVRRPLIGVILRTAEQIQDTQLSELVVGVDELAWKALSLNKHT